MASLEQGVERTGDWPNGAWITVNEYVKRNNYRYGDR